MAATVELRGRHNLIRRMQPEVVAATLIKVDDTWFHHATAFIKCNDNCPEHAEAFKTSCDKVVASIVQGSSGDRDVVKEYMVDVCQEGALQGKRHDRCQALASALTSAMSIDPATNRDLFKSESVCATLWMAEQQDGKVYLDEEKKAREAAEAARIALEEKAAEERLRREKEERAQRAAAKQIAEESKSIHKTLDGYNQTDSVDDAAAAVTSAEKVAEKDVAQVSGVPAVAADTPAISQNVSVGTPNMTQEVVAVVATAPETMASSDLSSNMTAPLEDVSNRTEPIKFQAVERVSVENMTTSLTDTTASQNVSSVDTTVSQKVSGSNTTVSQEVSGSPRRASAENASATTAMAQSVSNESAAL